MYLRIAEHIARIISCIIPWEKYTHMQMRRGRGIAVLVAMTLGLALLAAGCSSTALTATTAPAPTSVPQATSTPTPTPTLVPTTPPFPLTETGKVTREELIARMKPAVVRDAIPAILDPQFVAQEAVPPEFKDVELVLGMSINGESKAYPLDVLSHHEAVNDVVGGVPVIVTW